MAVSAEGPSGHWAVSAAIQGTPGAERSVRLAARNLALSDLIGLANPGTVPLATEMPISGHVAISVGSDGGITDLEGRLEGGKAMVLLDDPDAEPVFVDSLETAFGWDKATRSVTLGSFNLTAGDTRWALSGSITPPHAAREDWTVALASTDSQLAGETPKDKPVPIRKLSFEGRMPIGLGALFFDRVAVSGPDYAFTVSGAVGSAEGIEGLRFRLDSGPAPIRTALAFWPSFIAPEVRTYLVDNVESGTLQKLAIDDRLDPAALQDAFKKKPLPDDAVSISLSVTDGVMQPAPGLLVLRGIEMTGAVTGRTARFVINRATASPSPGKSLVFGKGHFDIADTTRKPAHAAISFDVAGTADAMLEALRGEALRPFVTLPGDVAGVKGQVEASVKIAMPLQPVLGPKDVAVTIQGTGMGLAADGIAGKEKLEDGNLTFEQGRDGLTVKGEARIGGLPAQLQMTQPAGGVADVVLSLVLDEAARAKRGIKLPGQVSGPMDARISIHDPGSPKTPQRVEIDLAKASLTDVLPGWTKPAGKPAKASFRLSTDGDTTLLDDFTLDGAGAFLKGSLRIGADAGLVSARFSAFRLAPGDDLHVDLDRTGGLSKATIRGTAMDARPLLKALTAPGGPGMAGAGDLDLDLKVATVQGLNGEALTGADLKLQVRGGDVRDFRLTGRLGQQPLAGQIAQVERGTRGIVIESADAGSFLRFLDIYRRMLGGSMLLSLSSAGAPMDGSLVINRFVLSNEPALARTTSPGEKGNDAPNNVLFTRLKAGFTVGGGKLVIRDATMWGQSVGGTLEGTLDFSRDQANLTGTFVPAYGLNNMINQVPLVGPIIGGGQHEGLFAVNFRISGRVSQPALTINPLSAVAPGFLRKFFGVFTPDETGEPPATTSDTGRAVPR